MKALQEGDFGQDQGDGFFIKTLKQNPSAPGRGETETAPPVGLIKPKTLAERQDMPRELANRLIKHYIDNLNNRAAINPIIDGLPQCVAHPFKSGVSPGCYKACTTGILPRSKDQTLGDVMSWVQNLIRYNYKTWVANNPALRGYVGGTL